MNLVYLILGAAPALALMALVARFDAQRPEPGPLLGRVTAWGAAAVVPAALLEHAIGRAGPTAPVARALYESWLCAAPVEEGLKALVLYVCVWRAPAFDERLDGIVYATRAALGMAAVENASYLAGTHSLGEFAFVFAYRAVLSVPGHAVYGGLMGYWAARRHFDRTGPGLAGGLAIAIALHGAYDAAIMLVRTGRLHGDALMGAIVTPVLIVTLGLAHLHACAATALRLDDADPRFTGKRVASRPLVHAFIRR